MRLRRRPYLDFAVWASHIVQRRNHERIVEWKNQDGDRAVGTAKSLDAVDEAGLPLRIHFCQAVTGAG